MRNLKTLKELSNFKIIETSELKLINAGFAPDCEGGNLRVTDSRVVYCDYSEEPGSGNCLMGGANN